MGDGSKAVQVGSRIAVTAEPGDDLSSLELPKEDNPASKKAESPKEQTSEASPKESQAEPKEERAQSSPSQSSTPKQSSGGKATKQTYPLYPSVQHLLDVNGLAKAEADKIPATGPNGRLLKGDVLAYIGKIDGSYPSELADRFTKLAHLDLSNIKTAPKKETPQKQAAKEAPSAVEEPNVDVTLQISLRAVTECRDRLSDAVGAPIPIATFVHRATEIANKNLPKSRETKQSADDLFNAVLGLTKGSEKKFSRGHFVPEWAAPPKALTASRSRKPDLLDVLVGKPLTRVTKPITVGQKGSSLAYLGPEAPWTLKVPKSEEKRARVFMERFKQLLEHEPAKLAVRE